MIGAKKVDLNEEMVEEGRMWLSESLKRDEKVGTPKDQKEKRKYAERRTSANGTRPI